VSRDANPVVTFPINKIINTEHFTDRTAAALQIVAERS